MMNNNLLMLCTAVLLLIMSSCADDELGPVLTFDTAGKGAYVKLLSETPRELDLMDLGSSSYNYEVEFVDIDQGNGIQQYDLAVNFVDNNPINGNHSSDVEKAFKSYSASEFNTSDRGFKSLSVSVPLSELLSLFGLSGDDLLANDQFRFIGTITTVDGDVFGFANSSSAVNGSAFQGHFNYTLKATCPLPDNIFVGDYTLTYQEVTGAWDESLVEGTVSLTTVPNSSTQRQFDAVFLDIFGGFGVTVKMDFVCTEVVFVTLDTGVGCGGSIILKPGPAQPVDINDGSADIVLHYVEDTGGCGAGAPTRIMTLTKN